jgi:Arc/MetJ-type ribon-helix-helix transcriptional regulator
VLSQNGKKTITVNITAPYIDGITILIEDGLYTNQTEIVKDALRRLFLHYEIKMVTEPQEITVYSSSAFPNA